MRSLNYADPKACGATANPVTDVQTVTVPPGGATMVEFKLEVPGKFVLVDHALSRVEKGLAGILDVEGSANPEIFHGSGPTRSAEPASH